MGNKEINIAEILKDKPMNTKLWSDALGEVYFHHITSDEGVVLSHHGMTNTVSQYGKMYKDACLCVFPSNSMRSWEKFAWKKGDVLQSDDGKIQLIFDGFIGESYKTFCAKHELTINSDEKSKTYEYETNRFTDGFSKVEDELAKAFIEYIEEKLGGKLNMETLEVTPLKTMEYIESKWTPKPFDRIVVRNNANNAWKASLFSHMKAGMYVAINGCNWNLCLPYNEETAKLIGTTDNWEG